MSDTKAAQDSGIVFGDWELQELVVLRGRGWSCKKLAAWYGVSDRTIQRILRKMEQERRGECLTEYR